MSLLTHPKTGAQLDLPVIGAIDAVVIDEEGPVLWELKTSKRKWAASQADLDPQLTIYRRAASELGFGDIRTKVLVTTKADSPQVQILDAQRSTADETELVELVFDVHAAMSAGVSYRQRGWACSSCPYSGACR